jgi:HAE1 family hydrophobic/amphiphilic exporter-1
VANLKELQTKIFDRMNPAVRFSVKRYVLAVGFFVAIVLFGLVSTFNLGVDLLPTVNIPVVAITVQYPGATPAVVDQQVTQVLEGGVSTLAGITNLSSNSSAGSSRIIVQLDASVDKNAAMSQISARVSSMARRLPVGINTPTVQTFDPNSAPILQFGVTAGAVPMEVLGSWVLNDLSPHLERVDGVANVTIDGAPTRQFQVLLDPNKLSLAGLNPQQVSGAIAASALNRPIGSITSNQNTLNFATMNLPGDGGALGSILVDATRGVRVKDLAIVRDVSVPTSFVRVNGRPAVLVSIQKSSEGNSVAVAKNVRDFLQKTAFPAGYKATISNDTTGPITASIDSTFKELGITALVVALICLLFLGKLNTTLSVVLAIPIALSAAPILFGLFGFSFNLVSLLAMIIAIGIVVDDSIVVSENVERYRVLGYSAMESVLRGASEVFSAVVAASLSLLSVLLPVSFLGGMIGAYVRQFSLGLAAAVFFSLVEAVLFLTVRLAYTPGAKALTWRDFGASLVGVGHAGRWALRSWRKGWSLVLLAGAAGALAFGKLWWWMPALAAWPVGLGLVYYGGRVLFSGLQALTMTMHRFTEAGLDAIREAYVRGLPAVLKLAPAVLVAVTVFFVATMVFLAPKIPFNFVPQSDSGFLNVSLRLPGGTPASVSNSAAGRLEDWLRRQPEVVNLQTVVASGGSGGLAGNAQITVQLVPIEHRRSSFQLAQAWRGPLAGQVKSLPSARVGVGAGSYGGASGTGSTVSFVLTSSDFGKLGEANQRAIPVLQANPWAADVVSSLSSLTLENDFYPEASKLQGTGLTPDAVALALQTYASGVQAGTVQIGSLSYPIQVRMDPAFLNGTRSLLNLPVYSPGLKTMIPVGQLGDFRLTPSPATLARNDRVYAVTLDVTLKPGAPPALAFQKQLSADLAQAGVLEGGVGFGSENRMGPAALAGQLATQGPLAFLLAVFLAYLVMGAQFNSWRYPLYLLLPVPLALVGALWLVTLAGAGLDIFGVLGMLLLIGLSAKNAILYLDFVVERLDHMPLMEALVDAARLRFRPIVMTTLTVLVISFPLIFSGGQGAEFGQKMGLVMFGGIVSSAVLTFFVVPSAFWLFERRRHQAKTLGLEGPTQDKNLVS